MQKTIQLIIVATVVLFSACNKKSGGYVSSTPKKDIDSVSYTIGVFMGKNL